jgi:hypothetical protein
MLKDTGTIVGAAGSEIVPGRSGIKGRRDYRPQLTPFLAGAISLTVARFVKYKSVLSSRVFLELLATLVHVPQSEQRLSPGIIFQIA